VSVVKLASDERGLLLLHYFTSLSGQFYASAGLDTEAMLAPEAMPPRDHQGALWPMPLINGRKKLYNLYRRSSWVTPAPEERSTSDLVPHYRASNI
jgi:hypothetical protein